MGAVSVYVTAIGSVSFDAAAARAFLGGPAAEWCDEFVIDQASDGSMTVTFEASDHRNLRLEPALVTAQLAGDMFGLVAVDCTDGSCARTILRFEGRFAVGGSGGCLRQPVTAGAAHVVELTVGSSAGAWDARVLHAGDTTLQFVAFSESETTPAAIIDGPATTDTCCCGGVTDDGDSICTNEGVTDPPAAPADMFPMQALTAEFVASAGLGTEDEAVAAFANVEGAYLRHSWPCWKELLGEAVGTDRFEGVALLAPAGLIAVVAPDWGAQYAAGVVPWSLLASTCANRPGLAFGVQVAQWAAVADMYTVELLGRWVRLRDAGMCDSFAYQGDGSFADMIGCQLVGLDDLDDNAVAVACTLFSDAVAAGNTVERGVIFDAAAAIRS